jgi:hypothetical protein
MGQRPEFSRVALAKERHPMVRVPSDKEIKTLLAADGKRRYNYFLQHVCNTREAWGLYGDGWAILSDGDQEFVPFWPHEIYAARFRKEGWSSYEPRAVDVAAFLERWIPKMKKDGVQPAIFPVGSGSSVVVSLDDLEKHLRYELARKKDEGKPRQRRGPAGKK